MLGFYERRWERRRTFMRRDLATVGMTMGLYRQNGAEQCLVGLAPIVLRAPSETSAIAWLGIDDTGARWIESRDRKDSLFDSVDSKLRAALGSSLKTFRPGLFDLWLPGEILPRDYEVESCRSPTGNAQ